MMATSDKEMQNTDCPVCHEKYSDPKILPCAHLLCHGCLVSWMKTETLCPLCRNAIVDPKHSNTKNWNAFVDSLPTDHAMSAMVEILKIFSEKHVCHVHSNADAVSLCLPCSVKLCQSCIEVHRKHPSTGLHKIEDLATLTPKILAANRQTPCSVHPDKATELVCVDHKVLICQLCATAKHRACSEVTIMTKVSGKYKQSLLEMENKLSAAESSLSHVITELEERLLKSEKSTNAALAEIDTTYEHLLKLVETCRIQQKKLITEKYDKMKATIYEQKRLILQKRGAVISHQELIRRVLQTVNDNSLIAMATYLDSRMNDLDTSLPQDTNSCLTVKLKIDRTGISRVEQELKNIIKPIFNLACGTEEIGWRFHANVGRQVKLKNNGQTAKQHSPFFGIIMSREPLMSAKLYEIQVEKVIEGKHSPQIGIVMENPSTVRLPYFPSAAIVIYKDCISANKKVTETAYGHALSNIKVGSTVGVLVDAACCLHLYVDGKDQGIAYRDVKHPCYALFYLGQTIKKVSTLPVTAVECDSIHHTII